MFRIGNAIQSAPSYLLPTKLSLIYDLIDDHWLKTGILEGLMMQAIYRRAERFIGTISEQTRVLEIGALHRPTLSRHQYNIEFADFASADTLKSLYSSNRNYDTSEIIDVDYVIENGDYIRAIGAKKFDLILASHVAEHIPDFIGWLAVMYEILDDNGTLSLILPDKRFTFDLIRQTTSTADLLTCHMHKVSKPTAAQIYHHVRNHIPLRGANLWALSSQKVLERVHSDADAWNIAHEMSEKDTYYDTHCSILTPESLCTNLRQLKDCGLMSFCVEAIFDTEPSEIDFQVRLKKLPKDTEDPRLDRAMTFATKAPYDLKVVGDNVILLPLT